MVANENTDTDAKPYLFRTYPSSDREADSHQIWEVARAASAADTYFIPMPLVSQASKKQVEYTDGGLGYNNPALLVLDEVLLRNGTIQPNEGLSVFMSIGAGQKPTKREKAKQTFVRYIFTSNMPGRRLQRTFNTLRDVGTAVDKDHQHMVRHFSATGFNQYYRWTGGEDVGGLKMDKWTEKRQLGKPATANFIEEKVQAYMNDPAVQTQLVAAASALVARRRARAFWHPVDGLWRRYTYCVQIKCPYDPNHLTKWFGSPNELKDHIIRNHPDKISSDVNLDTLVQGFYVDHPRFPGGPY